MTDQPVEKEPLSLEQQEQEALKMIPILENDKKMIDNGKDVNRTELQEHISKMNTLIDAIEIPPKDHSSFNRADWLVREIRKFLEWDETDDLIKRAGELK